MLQREQTNLVTPALRIAAGLLSLAAVAPPPPARVVAQTSSSHTEPASTHHATGTFEPVLTPAPLSDANADKTLGRMVISKQFHGGLEASTRGEMLTVRTATKGSMGYVAIEQVTGTLDGHAGTFTLLHSGIMDRGTPNLTVNVMPDSGTGQLTGLTGTITINVAPDGKHSYDLAYTLPQP